MDPEEEASLEELIYQLTELEQRVVDAESRAEDAEDKVRFMERRLNDSDWSPSSSPSAAAPNTSNGAGSGVGGGDLISSSDPSSSSTGEKDRMIQHLESEVEQQRQLRLADAKQVEAKAARIKDWVTNKLRELEDQNQHLKVQNLHCNEQMELLRKRLEQLQVMGASVQHITKSSTNHRSSVAEDSSLGSFEGEPAAASDESLPEIGKTSSKSKKSAKSSEPQAATRRTTGPTKNRDSRADSGSVDLETPISELSAKSPLDELDAALNDVTIPNLASASTGFPRPIPPPRGTKMGVRSISGRPESEYTNDQYSSGSGVTGSEAEEAGILPDRHRSLHMPLAPLEGKKLSKSNNTKALVMSDELHDYSEIYTPSNENAVVGAGTGWGALSTDPESSLSAGESSGGRAGSGDSGLTGLSSGTTAGDIALEGAPPPRPLHKYPSWEDRIYQLACEGVGSDPVVRRDGNRRDCGSNRNSAVLSAGYGNEISVPVYATVKGRANQLRSVPFTGDSSDSESEGEEQADTGRGTSSRTASSTTSGDLSLTSPRNVMTHLTGYSGANSGSVTNSATTSATSASPTPFKFNTSTNTLTVAPAGNNQTNFGGGSGKSISTVNLETSVCSDGSNDYAIPPDAGHQEEGYYAAVGPASSRISLCVDSPRKNFGGTNEKALEKNGYLTKLGGKIKSWKRRYFLLKNDTLSYWKSLHDVHRKPQGIILLDENCRISSVDGSNTFEIATADKTHYLTADSRPIMEEWVRVLQNVIQRHALKLLLSREDRKPTLEGWVIKVKNGHAKKSWCVLLGTMFVYFKNQGDHNPTGQINMRDSHVEEVEHISDSDSDENDFSATGEKSSELTVGIFPNHVHGVGPTYLVFSNKIEKEQWLYQLTVVSGGKPKAGTQFEQLVQKLMEEDGNANSAVWRNPLMVYSKDPITSPLTTFTSEALQAEALKMFKALQLFTSVVMESAGIDYHVMLAANALQLCLDVPELQPEFLCALIKQTSMRLAPVQNSSSKQGGVQVKNKHPHSIKHPRSFLMNATQLFTCDSSSAQRSPPTSAISTPGSPSTSATTATEVKDSKSGPANCALMQAWMLMSLAVSVFVPRDSKILWFIRTHFARNKNSKTEAGKYASYCSRALERAVFNGPRQARPSRMEVLSIFLKNPHQHSLPHALPVHFLNETYQVVGFDGSTTVAEFLSRLNADVNCRPVEQSGFALYSDDPIDTDVDHALHLEDKICDVISRWETALREKGLGKFENRRVIRFSYKNRLYWRRNIPGEGDKERMMLAYQVSKQIVLGQFPLNRDLAFELAALMAQIHYGDLIPDKTAKFAPEALERFFPSRYQDKTLTTSTASTASSKDLEQSLLEKWATLKAKSATDCVRIFLTCTRKWQFFGAKLFEVQAVSADETSTVNVWLAVHEDGISVLDHTSMQFQVRYPYDSIVTFGGCQDDFMLVVTSDQMPAAATDRISGDASSSSTVKLLFQTRKPEILEITLLIADYMNMIGKINPGMLTAPATPKLSSLSRAGSSATGFRASCHRITVSGGNSGANSALSTAPNTPRLDRSAECLSKSPAFSHTHSPGYPHHKKRQQFDSGVA